MYLDAMHSRRRLGIVALAFLFILPAVPVAAMEPTFSFNMNVDQQVVRPGGDLGITLYAYSYGRASSPTSAPVTVNLESIGATEDWTQAASLGRIRSQTQTVQTSGTSTQVVWTNLPAGIYRVEALVDGAVGQKALVQVTDLGLVVQAAGAERLVWAIQLSTGQPVAGAKVYVGDSIWTTGADGVAIVGSEGDIYASSAAGPARFASSGLGMFMEPQGRAGQSERIFVYTDRPLYRPGQTVHVKVVAWQLGTDGLAPLPGDAVSLGASIWRNGRQERLATVSIPLDAYGAGRADIDLPATVGLGTYELTARWREGEGHGSFGVEEYRLPGFKVTLSPTATNVAAGDDLELLIAAARFNGAPLDQAKVRYTVTGQPDYYSNCYWCDTPDGPDWSGSQESGDLELRSDGSALLRLATANPGSYHVEVKVTAPNGERIDQSLDIQVTEAGALLHIELPQQGLPAGQQATGTIRFTDLGGRPRDGHVAIDLVDTGRGATVSHFELDIKGGVATFDFTPPASGSYRLEGRASDGAGRTVTAIAWFWAAGKDDSFAGGHLQLRAEREFAEPGAELRFRVSSAATEPILVTASAGGFIGHRLVTGVETVAFATDAAKNADVHATALQLAPADSQSGSFLPQLRQAQASVQLSPHPEGLGVEITTDRAAYRNGETARILIQVRDAFGRPVQAQVGVAIVDEALLALRDASGSTALQAFYPSQGAPYPSQSWGSHGYGGGFMEDCFNCAMVAFAAPNAPVARDALDLDGEAFLAFDKSSIAVRSYFPETALWMPQLQTDANGILRLAVPLPDSLTTWKIDAQAITKHGQAGTGTTSLATMRNLEADIYAPRFLVAGDESTVQATVYNHLGEQRDIQVILEATGVETSGRLTRTISLAPGASGLISFPIAATASGQANLTFYAWSDGEPAAGDAVLRTLPVKPHGTPSAEMRSGRGAATLHLTVPADAAEGKGTLEVTVTPTIGNAMVDALPYLTGYPYGCVEQTLSRFLPDVAVARAADRLGIRDRIDADLDDQVKAGLERLYGFQHASGAWGWWTTDDDNEYTTAYTVYGLGVAKQAGYDVDADVLARGVAALAEMAKTSTGALHAYHVFALSVADPQKAPAVVDTTEPAELAMAILAAHAKGDDAWGQARVAKLVAGGIRDGDLLHWPDPVEGWTSHGMSSDAMVTALAIRAIVAVSPSNENAAAAVRWLLANRAGGNWDSTKDTAEAIFALVDFIGAAGDSRGASGATVTVDGQARTVYFDATSGWAERPALSFTVGPGDHTVAIAPLGDGPLYWSTALRHFDGGEPIGADAGAFKFERIVRNAAGDVVNRLKVGEEATVEVTVTANKEARYVQVEDPLAAGVEVVPTDNPYAMPTLHRRANDCFDCGSRMYAWSNAEVHDDRVAFFANNLYPESGATYVYTIRAIFPGCYHVLPTMALGMYDPTLSGHGDESSFCVDGPPELQAGRIGIVGEGQERTALVNLYPTEELPEEVQVRIIDQAGNEVETVTRPARPDEIGIVHVEVSVPQGDFQIVVTAGNVSIAIRHDATPTPVAADNLFNTTLEQRWGAGTVQLAASPLHRGAEPDYRTIFASVPKDDLVPADGPASTRVPWPMEWTLVALCLALVAMRRRQAAR